ncbi:MAG: endo-polygalacturonase [Opitutae bacterium]|nr:endo-polygalacturonase [Opitutae bacterium]
MTTPCPHAASVAPLLALLLGAALATTETRAAAPNQVVVYPAPRECALNTDFAIRVRVPGGEWQAVPTYVVKVDAVIGTEHSPRNSSLASFDFAGAVEVAITSARGAIQSARVRPLSHGIVPRVAGDTLTFTLTQPRNLSIEVNGEIFQNLQLFTNPLEENRPDPSDPRVIYFGPGVHDAGSRTTAAPAEAPQPETAERLPNPTYRAVPAGGVLRVPSHTTVYLAGGAVVRGRILCDGVEDIRIVGRGMIEQSGRGSGIRIAHSRHVEVRDIFTPQCFTGGSEHVTISGVRCISYVGNGDGMNVISSSDVLIDGVFNRNSDDCITVYGSRGGFHGDARRITVRNATLWADVAHPILVGTHGSTPHPEVLEQLRFTNLDILDHHEPQLDYQGCLALNAGDSNLIRDVLFEDVRVEDFRRGQLVNLRVFFNEKYCTSPGRGIEDVTFRRVTYTGAHAETSIVAGYEAARPIRNVVFEDLVINGVAIADDMAKPRWYKTADLARIFVGEHVAGLVFRRSTPLVATR